MAQCEAPLEEYLEKHPGKCMFPFVFGAGDTLSQVQKLKLTEVRPDRHFPAIKIKVSLQSFFFNLP